MILSFIVGFRNLDIKRVVISLDSLKHQSCQQFQMIFLDYGSLKSISSSIQAVLADYPFCKYYYSDTRGWIWNRSAALNTGARLVSTKYLFFTDIDIVYDRYFVEETLEQMREDIFLISDTRRVPQFFFDWSNIVKNGYDPNSFKSMKGRGVACFSKKHFDEIGGFDESYVYWGSEDNDLAKRMVGYGIREKISDKLRSYHQWHPRTSTDIPYSLLFHNTSHYYRQISENRIFSNRNVNWGKLIRPEDRPIYEFVDPDEKMLLSSEKVLIHDVYSLTGLQKWVTELEDLENVVLSFSQNSKNDRLTELLSKVLRRMNWRLDRKIMYLDDFALGLYFSVPGLFRDYFLDCNFGNKKHSVFLK